MTSYCVYLAKAVIPYETCLIYPYPERIYWWHFAGIVGAIGVVLGSIRWLLKARALAFGICFFTVNVVFLLQVLGAGHAFQADRFVYIGYIGLFFAMAATAQELVGNARVSKWVGIGLGGLLTALFAAMSLQYIPKWANSGSIWSDMIEKYPRRFPLAYVNRGEYLQSTRQGDLGMADFTAAIELAPLLHLGYLHRGDLYFERGEDVNAIMDYSRVLEILGPYGPDPLKNDAIAQAVGNRGSLHARNGRFGMALADLNQALSMHPEVENLRNSRGLTHFYMGNYAGALADFSAILQQNSNSVAALVNRGSCYFALHQWQEALADCDQALQLDPANQTALGIRQVAMDSLHLR
ncbi:MAG: tetratricopeptide repeat protein [Bacteroidia bacterium]